MSRNRLFALALVLVIASFGSLIGGVALLHKDIRTYIADHYREYSRDAGGTRYLCDGSPTDVADSRRAALDDDERVEGGEPRAVGLRIVGPGEDRGFLGVGEQDRSAARPGKKIFCPGLAQEFRRRGIDADRFRSRPPHDVEDRRARRIGEERIAGEVDVGG